MNQINTDITVLYVMLQMFSLRGNRLMREMSDIRRHSAEWKVLQADYYIALSLCDRLATLLSKSVEKVKNELSLMFDDEIEQLVTMSKILDEPILIVKNNEVVEMSYADILEWLRVELRSADIPNSTIVIRT